MSSKAVVPEPVRPARGPVSVMPVRAPMLQRDAVHGATGVSGVPSSVHSTLQSPGAPLDSGTRSTMESRFGHDFSQVRVHHDANAAMSAHDVGARAYTVGQDVVFGSGHYSPSTAEGQHLLAHELAHTIQQRGLQCAPEHISTDQGPEYRRLEHEAESVASAALKGGPVVITQPAQQPTLSKAGPNPPTPPAPDGTETETKTKLVLPASSSFTDLNFEVEPQSGFTAKEKTEESFLVDTLYVPVSKGRQGMQRFSDVANGGVLQSVIDMSGKNVSTAAWQLRDPPDTLRATWLQSIGLKPGKAADTAWAEAGGQATFPLFGGAAAQIDHIVELQLNGGNNAENLQPLDGKQNSDSGRALWNEVSGLARTIAKDSRLSSGKAAQIRMRFNKAVPHGTAAFASVEDAVPTTVPGTKLKRGSTCLSIAQAMTENVRSGATSAKGVGPAAPVTTTPYNVSVRAAEATTGGSGTAIQVPGTLPIKSDVDIPANEAAGQLISGLLLKRLKAGSGVQQGKIEASLDNRENSSKKTKLPLSLTGAANAIHFNVGAQPTGRLSLTTPSPAVQFTYPFLSPGRVTHISVTPEGTTNWQGEITPTIPFLGKLGVSYENDELKVSKGIDEATLKKHSLLGAKITKAELALFLAPEFKPEGRIEFQLGSGETPLITGFVKVNKDDAGLVAAGKLKLNIPKIDTAESDITYRAGGGRNEWEATIKIESSQIKLPYVKSGSLEGHLSKNDISFTGKVNFELPGGNIAEAGLKRHGNEWVFFGGGVFKIPKLDDTTVAVSYNTGNETFIATGRTGFKLANLGLTGHLSKVTLVAKRGEPPKVSGTGELEIKKGKANGKASVTLHENGKFSGKGHIEYRFTENITAGADVELDEKEKLHVTGELIIKRYELFKGYHDSKELFSLDLTIPIPGLSAGGIGVNAVIGGGVTAGYDFGPGVIEPLTFEAKFDPLESDPDLDLAVGGQVKIPVQASLTANIHAGIQVSVVVAKVEGGIQLTGTILLRGGLNAAFKARYHQKKFEANLTPALDLELLLRLALTAYVLAQAGFGWFKVSTRKDWKLAEKEVPTGAKFYLSAPFGYSSDKGITLPTADQITLKKPNIDVGALMHRLFSQTEPSEKEV